MSKPINVLTGIDYWLDNLMCNVPELAMCYHDNGIVQVSCTCHLMSAFFPLQSVRLRDSFGFTTRCYASTVLAMALCLFVCPSQVGVLLKRLNTGSNKQHHTIAQRL